MKSRAKLVSLLLLSVITASALMLKGCGGGDDDASTLGCPGGSVLASGSDIVNKVTGDGTLVTLVTHAAYSGTRFHVGTSPAKYSLPFSPTVTFFVTDQFASEKNDICVEFNANGIFWDRTFTSILGIRRYVTKTNAHGAIDLYYSSLPVLASAAAATAGGNPGTDASYSDQISAHSGSAQNAIWKLDVTVSGCPDPLVDPTPCP